MTESHIQSGASQSTVMPAGTCATAFRSRPGRTGCRHLRSVQRLLLSLLYLSLLSWLVTNGRAGDRRVTQGAVPQASVESRQIRLPIVDGGHPLRAILHYR